MRGQRNTGPPPTAGGFRGPPKRLRISPCGGGGAKHSKKEDLISSQVWIRGGDHTRLLGALGVMTRAKVKEFASVAVTDLVLSPKDNSMFVNTHSHLPDQQDLARDQQDQANPNHIVPASPQPSIQTNL